MSNVKINIEFYSKDMSTLEDIVDFLSKKGVTYTYSVNGSVKGGGSTATAIITGNKNV